jgi:hypothetical protein
MKIKYRIATAKAAFNKKKVLFTRKFDFNLSRKHLNDTFGAQLYVALKGRKVEQK